jgi:hypothetical protein
MILKNVIFNHLTYIQKFEVSLYMANETWFNNIQKGDLNLNMGVTLLVHIKNQQLVFCKKRINNL